MSSSMVLLELQGMYGEVWVEGGTGFAYPVHPSRAR